MYERFTDGARKAMQFANQAGHDFQHEYLGTEHILLGLLKESSALTLELLHDQGITPLQVEQQVRAQVQSGPMLVTGKLPQTPRAKRVIEFSMDEARRLNHNYVGVEHLLLGCLREQDGIASQALTSLGMTLERARENVETRVGGPCREDGLPVVQRLSPTSILLSVGKTDDTSIDTGALLLESVQRWSEQVGVVTAILIMGRGDAAFQWKTALAVSMPPEDAPAKGKP